MIGADYNVRIRDNYTPGGRVSASNLNDLARLINGMHGRDGITVRIERSGIVISGGGAGLDLSKFAFGWLGVSGQKAIIGKGYFEGRFGYHRVEGREVNVGGNRDAKHLIIVEGESTGAEIVPHSVAESDYRSDTAYRWRRILYRVYLKDGVPVMDMIGQGVGGIVL